ncbi:MAG TPA: membrane protein insertion efficiency factor YidD [Longimicrobium sp.]
MLARAMIAAIRFYQKGISPLKPPVCRFMPTCSQYGAEAIERYGAARGGWLLVKRLARCQPFSRGGWDPVP